MRSGDVSKVLDRLGLEYDHRGYEYFGRCPGHIKAVGREDQNPSWSINEETGAHHCFSCGYKGSLITLVADLLEFEDLDSARKWIRTNASVDLETLSTELAGLKDKTYYLPKPVPMSEARLAVFSDPPDWAMKERGLTVEACQHHGVRWLSTESSWITPIRNPVDFKLMGWQEKGQVHRHFRNRPTGLKKSSTLFGLEKFSDGQMVIVESPLDAVRLTSLGIPGGIATCGAIVSEEQIKLMRVADKIIVAMDNDDAGRKSSSLFLTQVRKLGMECWFFDYSRTSAKDIGDMSPREIESGLLNARHCAMGSAAISQ